MVNVYQYISSVFTLIIDLIIIMHIQNCQLWSCNKDPTGKKLTSTVLTHERWNNIVLTNIIPIA